MILLHRLTSPLIAVIAGLSYAAVIFWPLQAPWVLFLGAILMPLLLARLLNFDFRRRAFWIFLSTPIYYFTSALSFLLLVESLPVKVLMLVLTIVGIWLYTENLFTFYHLPRSYQAYALEYLSLILFVGSGFFLSSALFGAKMALQLPIWVPLLVLFWATLYATTVVLWKSKVDVVSRNRYAISGAILLTEVYVAIAMLPISYIASGALFAICLYLFLGLARAQVLDKLSRLVLRRYLTVGSALLLIILATSRWT